MKSISPHRNLLTHPYVLLSLTTLFWAGNAVVARGMRLEIPPFQLAFWRWSLASLLVFTVLRPPLRTDWARIKAGWKPLALLGTLGIGMFNTFQYLAVQTSAAINVGIISSTMPVFIVVMSFLLFWERVTRPQALGIVLSFAGVAVVVSGGDASAFARFHFTPGDLWMLSGMVIYGAYTVFLRFRPAIHPHSLLAVIIIIGTIELFPFMVWEVSRGQGISANSGNLLAISYTAIFPSLLAYLFFNRAVAEIGANRAGIFFNLVPVYVTLLATTFLGEILTLAHLIGMAFIVSGIALTSRDAKPLRNTVNRI